MPLILLEGVDGAGKTTAANELCELWDGPSRIIHKSAYDRDNFDEYENDLLDYKPGSGELVVLDRWHASELVYGHVIRGRAKLSAYDTFHIEQFLRSRGALITVVTAPVSTIVSRLYKRGEDFLPIDKVSTVNHIFLAMAQERGWLAYRSGVGRPDLLLDWAKGLEDVLTVADLPQSYIGPSQPSVLVACDPELGRPLPLQGRANYVPMSPALGLIHTEDVTPELLYRLGKPELFGLTPFEADRLTKKEVYGLVQKH